MSIRLVNRIVFGKKCLFLCLGLLFFNRTVDAQESITLNQCYDWAEINYPQIKQYDLIGQSEHYKLTDLTKGWLPQVAINAKATYQSSVTQLPFDTKELSTIMPGIHIPVLSKDQYQVAGEVSQQIWDGGMIRSSKQITQAHARVERRQLENELYVVRSRINALYFGWLLQTEQLRQNELLQQNLVLNIDRVKGLMESGMANPSDLDNLLAEQLTAEHKAVQIRSARTAFLQMSEAFTGKGLSESVHFA